jgi:hypothetical protein
MGPGAYDRRLDVLQVRTLRTLIDQDCVGRLRTLDLRGLGLRDDAARCLLRCRQRLNLRRLDLSGNPISQALGLQLREQFGTEVVVLHSPDDEIPF